MSRLDDLTAANAKITAAVGNAVTAIKSAAQNIDNADDDKAIDAEVANLNALADQLNAAVTPPAGGSDTVQGAAAQ